MQIYFSNVKLCYHMVNGNADCDKGKNIYTHWSNQGDNKQLELITGEGHETERKINLKNLKNTNTEETQNNPEH